MIEELNNKEYTLVKEIKKGWSSEKKFYIETADNRKLLMRVSDIAALNQKETEFKMMQSIFNLHVPIPQPLNFGISKDGKHVFALLAWIDGRDAEEAIPMLPVTKQYELGVDAGEILSKIHSNNSVEKTEDWSVRYNRKIENKIALYNSCEIKIPNDKKIIEYILNNRNLLLGRPTCFQHGDYHIGNMILSDDNKVSIIDFNRFDFGDPWEEFNRITFSAIKSPAFAKGIVDGYFKNNVPDYFFRLSTLYICVNMLAAFPWAIPYGKQEIDFMLNMIEQTMRWYDGMKSYLPMWYKEV